MGTAGTGGTWKESISKIITWKQILLIEKKWLEGKNEEKEEKEEEKNEN